MICDACGAKYNKKAAALHVCPAAKKRGGRRRPGRYVGSPRPRSNWSQLDLFEDFARRGLAAQAAVDALTKRRKMG